MRPAGGEVNGNFGACRASRDGRGHGVTEAPQARKGPVSRVGRPRARRSAGELRAEDAGPARSAFHAGPVGSRSATETEGPSKVEEARAGRTLRGRRRWELAGGRATGC